MNFLLACFALGIALVLSAVSAASAQPVGKGPNMSVETFAETDAVHAGATVRVAVRVGLGEGWHVNAHTPGSDELIPTSLSVSPAAGASVGGFAYPTPLSISLQGSEETLAVYGGSGGVFVIGVKLALDANLPPGLFALDATLKYQACDTKQCYPPASTAFKIPLTVVPADQPVTPQHQEVFATMQFDAAEAAQAALAAPASPTLSEGGWRTLAAQFAIKGDAAGYLGAKDFVAFLDRVESGVAGSAKNPLAEKGLWFVVLTVVVGGLLLNLTPCVLPLIPINLGIIGAGAKAGSRSRGFLLGGTYGVGIALTYGVLGLVVILGVSKTFGAINATPWFNAAIAIIFVALALAMFDVFLIDFTRFRTKLGVKRKEGGSFVAAFLMGVISALLAGACVAPVIISTIVYAQNQYAKGQSFALFLPFLVGAGMALPWPFAGAGLSFLPKPGAWMERIKQAFGVLILLFALYYGHLAYSLFSDRYLVDKQAVQTAAQQMDNEGWLPSLSQGLAQAQQEHKPVFIDFWATWCKNCLTMNQTTFKNADVIKRLEPYVKVKCQAENPGDPATREIMEHFGVVGLPTYVVLEPN